MELDQPVSLWEFSRAAEERNESEEEARGLVKEEEGGKKYKSNNNRSWEWGKRLGMSDRSETSMLFWVILSHTGRRTYYPLLVVVVCVIYIINLVLPVIYMVSIRHLQGGTGNHVYPKGSGTFTFFILHLC
jgi:hypothetical protein